MNVLATAYACEPGKGSEAGIGWHWARQIALRHDLWLVTRENNVEAIEREARAQGLGRLRVVGFDLPPWARAWKRGSRGAVAYFSLWQRSLAGLARELDRKHGFDVVHHLTFASSWIPSGLAELEPAFVWGPVGQHPRVPDGFLAPGALLPRAAEPAKALARWGCARLDPALARTLERSDLILSLSHVFERRLPRRHRHKLVRMLAAGVEPPALEALRFQRGAGLRVLFAGRLVDLKGVRLALEAFAYLAAVDSRASFELCGDGPLRPVLEARARELGLAARVHLAGHLDHATALRRMQAADVFLFPSFEGGGMVVPEAMAAGCPIVCLDYGGPGDMTGDDRGVRVPIASDAPETSAALGRALVELAGDERRRGELARGARRWAVEVASWDAKGARLDELYERARQHRAGRERGPRRTVG